MQGRRSLDRFFGELSITRNRSRTAKMVASQRLSEHAELPADLFVWTQLSVMSARCYCTE